VASAPREPGSRPRFTSQQILTKIREWEASHGSPPTTKDWEPSRALATGQPWRAKRFAEGEWPSLGMVQRRFGTFNAAIREAGFEPRPPRAPTCPSSDSERDRILGAIVDWTRRYGAPPSQTDWDPSRARRTGQDWRAARFADGQWPSLRAVRRQFGTLSQAIEAVGLRARRPGEHGRSEFDDRPHNLYVLAAHSGHQRDVKPRRTDLAAAVRAVALAQRGRDPDVERDALLELASVALALADDVVWGPSAVSA
jgi:hypothetical protein